MHGAVALIITLHPQMWPHVPARPDLVQQVIDAAIRGFLAWRHRPRLPLGTEMVSLARKNLLHDRLRFAITVAGVAFAVTLVLVQVGLFMGLLAKATVTIEHASADIWVTSKNTPNVDFAHTFPETAVLRVRGVPGVERADNLIVQFMNIQLPNGAEEGCLVYALEDFRAWNLPWNVQGADVGDLRRGGNILMDRSAERRFGPFAIGDYREILRRRFKIIGTTTERRVLHHRAHRLHGLRQRAGAQRDPAGPDVLRAGEDRARAPTCRRWRRRSGGGCPSTTCTRAASGRASRGRIGWSPRASA